MHGAQRLGADMPPARSTESGGKNPRAFVSTYIEHAGIFNETMGIALTLAAL